MAVAQHRSTSEYTPASARPLPTRTSARAGLILFAFSSLLSVALAEGALRVGAASSEKLGQIFRGGDPLAVEIEPHGQLGYRPKPGTKFTYANGTAAHMNAAGYRGPLVAVPKPAGTMRVVLLGGSTSHGWGVRDDQTISVYLQSALASRLPGRRVEVVNLAFDGYDSYQDFERLRSDGLPLAPDVVIMNSGINDVRNARFPHLTDHDPRTILWAATLEREVQERLHGGPSLWSRTKHVLYLARIPAIVRDLRAGKREEAQGKVVPMTPNPEAIDYFERNVTRVADLTSARGIPLVLSFPPSELAREAPTTTSFRSYWINDAGTTERVRDSLAARMVAVAARRAAAGEPIVYDRPVLGAGLYLDDCHPTAEGNRRIAEAFAGAVLAQLARRGAPAPGA